MAVAASGAESVPAHAAPALLAATDSRRRLTVGVIGIVLVIGGAILQLIALLNTSWFKAGSGSTRVRLGFGSFADQTQRGFAHIYFAWGAWVLFALTLAFGLAACVSWPGARAFRLVGAVLGVLAAVATISGVLVFAYQTDVEVFHVARNYAAGVYLAMLGCLATGFGAAAGLGAAPGRDAT
jgi:hypothetical protein